MELNTAIEILEYHQEWRLGKREDMIHEPKKLTEALDIVLSEVKKFRIGAVSGWRYFSSQYPKWNSNLEIVWSDGTEDIFNWTKQNAEQLDFDIDCKPIKWRYACR